ncbi:uncharacterized protein METZ01_LOCUS431020, partial [marine metagenome]
TVSQISTENEAERRRAREDDFHDFATGVQGVTRSMGRDAVEMAEESEIAKKGAERVSREIAREGEGKLRRGVAEDVEEDLSDREMRKIRREGRVRKAKAEAAREMRDEDE